MPQHEGAPIIIIKKKQHHAGHHGGAWKVAYADFVTAMMALFIVLWLLNSNVKIKKAVESYFKDPTGKGKQAGTSVAGAGENLTVTKDDMSHLSEKLKQAMKAMPQFQKMKDNIQITITNEGLRVELLETAAGMFFGSGNSQPSESGRAMLMLLAKELGELPNTLLIEGHTDSKPYVAEAAYSNWELSADRANASRRELIMGGMEPAKIVRVVGLADSNLQVKDDPRNPLNRRISIIVMNKIAEERMNQAGGEIEAGSVDEVRETLPSEPRPEAAPAEQGAPVAPTAASETVATPASQ